MFPQRRRGNAYGRGRDFPIAPWGGRWYATTSDHPVYALGKKLDLGTCDEREDLYHHAVSEIFKRLDAGLCDREGVERYIHNLALIDTKPNKGSR
jgi:hypothetical protein